MSKKFNELRKINVSDHIEKKNGMSYLSWTYAVDTLLQADPTATWEFLPHLEINGTIMVRCQVHAFEKTMFMQLAVFDYKNQAIKDPNACQVSNSMMRCLVKCIACFGIGLYIYAGEDLPEEDANTANPHSASNMQPREDEVGIPSTVYRVPFGKFVKKSLDEIDIREMKNYIEYLENKAVKDGKEIQGVVKDFIDKASSHIAALENQQGQESQDWETFKNK
jgi:hypothetical protein